ncbi:hypothetical protein [Actinoplanes sp. NPDC051494]|uniref:hypothetical protein n=1 Tax=Actinoplanes sp. NPDC051494 TaxID=3363907 RepID=UPI0037B9100B
MSPRFRKGGLAATAGIAVLVAAVASLRPGGPGPPADGSGLVMICPLRQTSEEICGRPVRGAGDRLPGSTAPGIEETAGMIAVLAADGGWCITGRPGTCAEGGRRLPPTESDVRVARSGLTEAGFPDHVVRLARPGDPAPEGALLYAVKIGDVCVIGDTETVPRTSRGSSFEILGPLPDGSCLDA